MRYLFLLSFLISSAFAVEITDTVKSFQLKGKEYLVEFAELGKMAIPKENPNIACIENGFKSKMKVVMEVDEHHGYIDKCMLYEGPNGMKPVHPNKLKKVKK